MSTGTKFSTNRLPRLEFIEYSDLVFKKLYEKKIIFSTTKYYSDKLTFGDLDIIIPKPVTISDIKYYLDDYILRYDINSDVISVLYKGFQIDFITISESKFEIASDYYTYADLSCIIGRLFKKYNITFGIDGLVYEHDTKFNTHFRNIGKIKITDDFSKILELINLDYNKYLTGFNNRSELLDYVSKCMIYNPDFFNTTKKHEEKIEKLFTECKKYNNINCVSIEMFYKKIELSFPELKFLENIEKIKQKEISIKINSEKFNGNIILQALPDINKFKLSLFIVDFKKSHIDFDLYISNSDKYTIIADIVEYYNKNKEKYGVN